MRVFFPESDTSNCTEVSTVWPPVEFNKHYNINIRKEWQQEKLARIAEKKELRKQLDKEIWILQSDLAKIEFELKELEGR